MQISRIRVLTVETEKLFMELRGGMDPTVKLKIKEPTELTMQELNTAISSALAEWHNGSWNR